VSFISYQFLIFLSAATTIYFVLPSSLRWGWLLLCSCIFYISYIPIYIFFLFFLILVDYTIAILMEQANPAKRKWYLLVSIAATCASLLVFKYFNFFNANMRYLTAFLGMAYPLKDLTWAIPIGLSFHTFQSLSYVIEVYQGKIKAERHLGFYALYVMFFPQLVSGPIERGRNLIPQLRKYHAFNEPMACEGLRLILWGMFQKIVIADRLGVVVNRVYENLPAYEGLSLVIALVFFSFQIYCDFAGYSNIAIGCARILGIRLMCNFSQPYLAVSFADFWHRWHISLSTWFRDYVFIPLGGSRVASPRWHINIIITFLLSGLWHGAQWTFVLWGTIHGFFYLAFGWTVRLRQWISNFFKLDRWPLPTQIFSQLITFSLITLAWVFFRARSLQNIAYIFSHLNKGWDRPLIWDIYTWGTIGLDKKNFMLAMGSIAFLLVIDLLIERFNRQRPPLETGDFSSWLVSCPKLLRRSLYIALTLAVFNWGVSEELPFIYFQF